MQMATARRAREQRRLCKATWAVHWAHWAHGDQGHMRGLRSQTRMRVLSAQRLGRHRRMCLSGHVFTPGNTAAHHTSHHHKVKFTTPFHTSHASPLPHTPDIFLQVVKSPIGSRLIQQLPTSHTSSHNFTQHTLPSPPHPQTPRTSSCRLSRALLAAAPSSSCSSSGALGLRPLVPASWPCPMSSTTSCMRWRAALTWHTSPRTSASR